MSAEPTAENTGFTMGEHIAFQWFVDGAKERTLLAGAIDAALAAAVTAEREKYLRVADDLPEALLRAAHHDGVIRPHSFDHNGVSEIVGRYDAIAALAARRIREVTT